MIAAFFLIAYKKIPHPPAAGFGMTKHYADYKTQCRQQNSIADYKTQLQTTKHNTDNKILLQITKHYADNKTLCR